MYHHDHHLPVRGSAVVILLAVLCLMPAGAGLGFWLAHSADSDAASAIFAASDGGEIILDVVPTAGAAEDVNAMAAQLAAMEAELLRLNALGERLVKLAGLDPREFDFVNPPPQGGADRQRVRDYTIKELANELGSVVDALVDRQQKLDVLDELLVEKDLRVEGRTVTAPSSWPVRSGYVSSRFGYRIHPTKRVRMFHEGVDIACARGTPIAAVAAGEVIYSGTRSGYGRVIDIRHDNGLVTRYAHNASNLVRVGQQVQRGQQIANVGTSGTATGPHVHFEVLRANRPLDPTPYLNSDTAWRTVPNTAG
ncbi:peptidase M23 [Chromatium okenii]|nr:M23 family metallopeptidase [Chromatium okenii]MBK1641841.1 peptidase M23 [Chromatium okenii]